MCAASRKEAGFFFGQQDYDSPAAHAALDALFHTLEPEHVTLMEGPLNYLDGVTAIATRLCQVLQRPYLMFVLRDAVADCYCLDNGRSSIDPESALRLKQAGFLQAVVHDRKLLREAQVNIALRWFCGYSLDDTLLDHSSLTRLRQRWVPRVFHSYSKRPFRHAWMPA